MKKIVVALGGNALQAKGMEATSENQLKVIKETVVHLADMIEAGYELVVTHGNGPQVGKILIQNEVANSETPAMDFDVCGAMSQGMIGYHITQALKNELAKRNINKEVSNIVTQVVVDKNDKGFTNPTKPIGPFYTKEEADKLAKEKGYDIVEDSGRGYRRVVASPKPERIVELSTIETLVDNGNIVIAVGGGGVPVIEENNFLKGAAAVIDKDLASEKLAEDLNADTLLILTAVEKVCINFGKENQEDLDTLNVENAKKYIEEGHFAPGSMLPKVEAVMKFASSKEGRKAIITSLDNAKNALAGTAGTTIMN